MVIEPGVEELLGNPEEHVTVRADDLDEAFTITHFFSSAGACGGFRNNFSVRSPSCMLTSAEQFQVIRTLPKASLLPAIKSRAAP
jgi:hypothetical protein